MNKSQFYNTTQLFEQIKTYKYNSSIIIVPPSFISTKGDGDKYISQITLMEALNPSLSLKKRDVIIREPTINFTYSLMNLPTLDDSLKNDLSMALSFSDINYSTLYDGVNLDLNSTRVVPN